MNISIRSLLGCLLLSLALPATAACPRIVTQSPYLTAALEWLGRGECIVGVSRYDLKHVELPRTGGVKDPDSLAIDMLSADLVIVSRATDGALLAADLTPPARVVQVDGFDSMAGAEAMLRELARVSAAPGGEARVDGFAREWRAAAAAVGGGGRRALVLSACSALPYSFGRGHVVGDLFAHAGFDVVETAPRIRHLRDGEEIPDLLAAVERLKPEVVISLHRVTAEHCNAQLGMLPVRLVMVTGEHFFQPGPDMIKGLAELAEQMRP